MEKENVNEAPSLPSENETAAVVKTDPSAQDVANAFLKQYYMILQTNAVQAHNFYKEESIRSHPCDDGLMKSATTLEGINELIMASNIKEWNPKISSVFAQDSVLRSVIVGVTGSLTDNNNVTRKFTQTFFLAPQEGGGFYVHNDFLQFIETNEISETPLTAPEANVTAKDFSVVTEQAPNKDQTDKSTSTKKDVDVGNKVSDSSKGKNPLPAEAKKKSQPSAWQPAPSMQELAKRMSYASILAKEGSVAPSPQASPNSAIRVLPTTEKKPTVSLAVPKQSVPTVKPSAHPSNGPPENICDFKAIRVKDLPQGVTQESLLEVVKKFGPVKLKNIQIKEYSEDGYRYAFVGFDYPKSARFAVEERYIQLEDRDCEIQYKRSFPNQGEHHYMEKPQSGRGGFRNDHFWGRDGEGRNNNNWGHRYNEHENSGQYSGQTRDYNFRRNNNNNNNSNRYFHDQARY